MIRDWLNKNLSLGEKWVSIEAVLNSSGDWYYNYLLLKVKGKKLLIEASGNGVEDINVIVKRTGTDFPVLLSLTGKGTLIKPAGDADAEPLSMEQVFPNARTDEFLFQYYTIGQHHYLALMRQEVFNEVFSAIKTAGLKVVAAYLGPLPAHYAALSLEEKTSVYTGSCFELQYREEGIPEVKPRTDLEKQSAYKFEGQELNGMQLSVLGNIIAYRNHRVSVTQPEHEGLAVLATDEAYRIRFEKTAQIGLVCLLFLMIVNKLVSYEYTRKLAELEVEQTVIQGETQASSELRKELEFKRQLAKTVGMDRHLPVSYYADQVGALIPHTIQLTALEVFPINQSENKDDKGFDYQLLRINGNAEESGNINRLVKDLKNLEWVEEAEVGDVQEREDELGFTVNVKLKAS